jgi:hypothetical protein
MVPAYAGERGGEYSNIPGVAITQLLERQLCQVDIEQGRSSKREDREERYLFTRDKQSRVSTCRGDLSWLED